MAFLLKLQRKDALVLFANDVLRHCPALGKDNSLPLISTSRTFVSEPQNVFLSFRNPIKYRKSLRSFSTIIHDSTSSPQYIDFAQLRYVFFSTKICQF